MNRKEKFKKIEQGFLRGATIGGLGSSIFVMSHATGLMSTFGQPVALIVPASIGAAAGIEAFREYRKLKKVI